MVKTIIQVKEINLAAYKSDLDIGAPKWKQILWYYVNAFVFNSYLFPVYGFKRYLLYIFGAKMGKKIVIKPKVNIKYPWKLSIGDYSWIGEKVWIDNLDEVEIGSHVVLSQGALLLSGNHNYKKDSFDLLTGKIVLEKGVWIGARAVVTGGVHCSSHSILSVNSVASKDLKSFGIYSGNPAKWVRERMISTKTN